MKDLICVTWLQMSTFKDTVRWCISNTLCLAWFMRENDIRHLELSVSADKPGQNELARAHKHDDYPGFMRVVLF